MNSPTINLAIDELMAEIALRQDAVKALQALNGNHAPVVPRETSVRTRKDARAIAKPARRVRLVRTETPAAPVSGAQGTARPTSALPAKPATVTGALKRYFHESPLRTRGSLRALLLDDADVKDLFQETAFKGALAYWVKTEKLKQTGDGDEASYTVTDKA